jgi:hypothetical protein
VPTTLGRFVLAISQDLAGELYLLPTGRGGPTGSSGEVFAIQSAATRAEAGTVAGLDPTAWWIVLLFGALVGALIVVWLISRDRGGTPRRGGERGEPSRA